MSQYPPLQFPLGRKAPLPVEQTHGRVLFNVTLAADGNRICLTMHQEGEGDKDYIAIKQDSLVEIVLHGDQIFFSKAYDGVTMKGPDLEHYYGQLEYDGYDEKLDRYKVVRFVARFNKGGKYDTTHGFNINIDLLLHGGPRPRWVGLTIDPDIKNPPPKPSY